MPESTRSPSGSLVFPGLPSASSATGKFSSSAFVAKKLPRLLDYNFLVALQRQLIRVVGMNLNRASRQTPRKFLAFAIAQMTKIDVGMSWRNRIGRANRGCVGVINNTRAAGSHLSNRNSERGCALQF